MRQYDIKILQGIAEMTAGWAIRRTQFFEFACREGGNRWKDQAFRQFMNAEYIRSDTPITMRIYSLDPENRRLLLRYIEEKLMNGLVSETIEI